MLRLARQFTQYVFRRQPSLARKPPPLGTLLDSGDKLEEETLRWYSPDLFYPVKIGDVFRSRYQVIGKLGFGGYSTVWLCRDLQQHDYVVLKLFEHDSGHGKREKEIYNHLATLNSTHTGSFLVRRALDDFQLRSTENSRVWYMHL
ncbi:kinase-like domain-containing protein [Penicillium herquei]|nr:kinase-like domain-containing protein [Penicillium herquei]